MSDGGTVLPQPKIDEQTAGFWTALEQHRRLEITRCTECQARMHPPALTCRRCGRPTRYEPVSGDGRVYSFIVSHRPAGPVFADLVPYVVALIELAEDPSIRLPAFVTGEQAAGVGIGCPGRLVVGEHPMASEPVLLFERAAL